MNEKFFLMHHLVFPPLLLFEYEEYQDFWWDYNVLSPPNCWNGKEGLFPANIFLLYFLVMALVLPVYRNILLVCLLGKPISQSSHDLF